MQRSPYCSFAGAQKLRDSDVIADLDAITIKVISKKSLVQRLQNALERDMMRKTSKSLLDNERKGDPDTCGFFCCPVCCDDHQCGVIDPADYI